MRFLSVNHLRLGSSPGGIPPHLASDSRAFSSRAVWQKAVALAASEEVHALLLSGETLSATNTGLEPWGPLLDGLAELQQNQIPIIAVPHGEFTPRNLARFNPDLDIHWLQNQLDWEPIFTTTMDELEQPAVRVIDAALAEHENAPIENPITLDQMDSPDSIWILTSSLQPDSIQSENALVIEPGSTAPLSSHETGQHGAWLIDTDTRDAELKPLANIEFTSIELDVSNAEDLDNLERIISEQLADYANYARANGSGAHTVLADITLTGTTRLYSALADITQELQEMLVIQHNGMSIGISNIEVDATPPIDLTPLLNRPDPVGEIARLISALDSGDELSDAHARLLTATEQKMLAVTHARVFGSILDTEPNTDAPTLLRRQGWATLDALVRQRGID